MGQLQAEKNGSTWVVRFVDFRFVDFRQKVNTGRSRSGHLRLIKAWVKNDFRLQCPPARFAEFAWTARVTIVTWNQDRVVRERHPPF